MRIIVRKWRQGCFARDNKSSFSCEIKIRLIITSRLPDGNEDGADSHGTSKTRLILARKRTTDWLPCEDQVGFHFTITARKWRQGWFLCVSGWLAHKNQDSSDYRAKPRLILKWQRRPGRLSLYICCTEMTTRLILVRKLTPGWVLREIGDEADYHFTITARESKPSQLLSYDYRAKLRWSWLSL